MKRQPSYHHAYRIGYYPEIPYFSGDVSDVHVHVVDTARDNPDRIRHVSQCKGSVEHVNVSKTYVDAPCAVTLPVTLQ